MSVGARLEGLDRVIAMALHMALGLEQFASIEGSLVLGGLSPLAYLAVPCALSIFRYKRSELIYDLPSSVHQLCATLVEIG